LIKIINNLFKELSLLNNKWSLKDCNERQVLTLSQRNKISPILAKLLTLRKIETEEVERYLNFNLYDNLPNPFLLKDMEITIDRVIQAIEINQNIGIIADYDVDGSTSAAILIKFFEFFPNKLHLKIPDRLNEGYGPNTRIMNYFLKEKINLVFTLDCGTSSFGILDSEKYKDIDIIVIDHHLGELKLPKVFSIINPNRFDENSEFNEMAAVGVTFLFLMALRKKLREKNFFSKIQEPNLLTFLDLVALGTVCDVVKLNNYNRIFVKIGLDLIKKRKNKSIAQIIDNSNLYYTPTASDLGYVIGPQLNAASRVDDSSLPSKLLISKDNIEIEQISRKLILFNKKRKLIENNIFDEALIQAKQQVTNKFIVVHGFGWHKGVLGIIASRLINQFYKPTIVISFDQTEGTGSARSINMIDLGNIILSAKNKGLLISGGGHKMAAGLRIKKNLLEDFCSYLTQCFYKYDKSIFQKIEEFDLKISINSINQNLLEDIEKLEPFGNGNEEPKFIITDIKIEYVKVLKEKHLLIFFQNDYSINLRAICFNCISTKLGEYLLHFKNHNFILGCTIKRDNYKKSLQPQMVIEDVMILN
jgi:single-stranded-DNA-specific exonuclease